MHDLLLVSRHRKEDGREPIYKYNIFIYSRSHIVVLYSNSSSSSSSWYSI